jgi:hypothetical protein
VVVATVRGGAPNSTVNFRLVEGNGVLLWVDRSLRFRGNGIDLDVGYAGERMVVYAINFTPGL